MTAIALCGDEEIIPAVVENDEQSRICKRSRQYTGI